MKIITTHTLVLLLKKLKVFVDITVLFLTAFIAKTKYRNLTLYPWINFSLAGIQKT